MGFNSTGCHGCQGKVDLEKARKEDSGESVREKLRVVRAVFGVDLTHGK